MNMERIRTSYGVPAKRGGRVAYGCEGIGLRTGTIVGSCGDECLRIRLDGEKVAGNYRPDWNIIYLTLNDQAKGPAQRRPRLSAVSSTAELCLGGK